MYVNSWFLEFSISWFVDFLISWIRDFLIPWFLEVLVSLIIGIENQEVEKSIIQEINQSINKQIANSKSQQTKNSRSLKNLRSFTKQLWTPNQQGAERHASRLRTDSCKTLKPYQIFTTMGRNLLSALSRFGFSPARNTYRVQKQQRLHDNKIRLSTDKRCLHKVVETLESDQSLTSSGEIVCLRLVDLDAFQPLPVSDPTSITGLGGHPNRHKSRQKISAQSCETLGWLQIVNLLACLMLISLLVW